MLEDKTKLPDTDLIPSPSNPSLPFWNKTVWKRTVTIFTRANNTIILQCSFTVLHSLSISIAAHYRATLHMEQKDPTSLAPNYLPFPFSSCPSSSTLNPLLPSLHSPCSLPLFSPTSLNPSLSLPILYPFPSSSILTTSFLLNPLRFHPTPWHELSLLCNTDHYDKGLLWWPLCTVGYLDGYLMHGHVSI